MTEDQAKDRQTIQAGGTVIGWSLVGALSTLLGLAVPLAWILSSYFSVDIPASLSFPGDDGWCEPPAEGLGLHCFGDYSSIRFDALTDQPIGPEAVYPISSRIVRIPFMLLGDVAGSQVALLAFIAAAFAAALTPVLWSVRHVPWTLKPVVVTVAGVATWPFLMIMDRGNTIAFAVPLVLGYLLALMTGRGGWAAASVIALSTIKPQFAVMTLALVSMRYWRPAVAAGLGSVAAVILPYLVLGADLLGNVGHWIDASLAWSASVPLSNSWPVNISLPHLLIALGVQDEVATLSAQVFAVALAAALVIAGRRLDPFLIGTAFTTLAVIVLPVSFGYYAGVFLAVAAVLFRHGLARTTTFELANRATSVLIVGALALSLSPIVLPRSLDAPSTETRQIVASVTPAIATLLWTILLGVLAIHAVAFTRKSRRHTLHRGE